MCQVSDFRGFVSNLWGTWVWGFCPLWEVSEIFMTVSRFEIRTIWGDLSMVSYHWYTKVFVSMGAKSLRCVSVWFLECDGYYSWSTRGNEVKNRKKLSESGMHELNNVLVPVWVMVSRLFLWEWVAEKITGGEEVKEVRGQVFVWKWEDHLSGNEITKVQGRGSIGESDSNLGAKILEQWGLAHYFNKLGLS